MNFTLRLFSLFFYLLNSWQQGSATKFTQKAFNQAFRINSQLDQWENSHIFTKNQQKQSNKPVNKDLPEDQVLANQKQNRNDLQNKKNAEKDDEKILKFKKEIFEERKKFAQEWVDKKNKQNDRQAEYYVDQLGKVNFKQLKQKKNEFDNIQNIEHRNTMDYQEKRDVPEVQNDETNEL